jgi:hypothetical protein
MATETRNFKISDAPLVSSSDRGDSDLEDASNLPSHYGAPLLLAIARNPHTLFICWSVDWPAAFGSNIPADRQGHVKLKGGASERVQPVEPMSGYSSIADLEPGETYAIELGFYAPANQWHVIASEEVTMPPQGQTTDVEGPIDVATVPFHLSFQRLTELFGGHVGLAHSLAVFEERMANNSTRSQEDEELLRALDLSLEDLEFIAAIRQALSKVKPSPAAETFVNFGWSSPSGSSWS